MGKCFHLFSSLPVDIHHSLCLLMICVSVIPLSSRLLFYSYTTLFLFMDHFVDLQSLASSAPSCCCFAFGSICQRHRLNSQISFLYFSTDDATAMPLTVTRAEISSHLLCSLESQLPLEYVLPLGSLQYGL